jgi:hypothetical protein
VLTGVPDILVQKRRKIDGKGQDSWQRQ